MRYNMLLINKTQAAAFYKYPVHEWRIMPYHEWNFVVNKDNLVILKYVN